MNCIFTINLHSILFVLKLSLSKYEREFTPERIRNYCSHIIALYSTPMSAPHHDLRLSALALRSRLNFSNCAFSDRPSSHGCIRKAGAPENSSNCLNVVPPLVVSLSSNANVCSPATPFTCGPCHWKRVGEFSCVSVSCCAGGKRGREGTNCDYAVEDEVLEHAVQFGVFGQGGCGGEGGDRFEDALVPEVVGGEVEELESGQRGFWRGVGRGYVRSS
jgi:hypothetical protein